MPSSTTGRRALPMRALRQRHQRERAALAVVVGAQQDDDVFQRDDDDQRPEDQRQHAEHRARASACRRRRPRRPPPREGVERAGADVAIDDADAAEGEHPEAGCGAVPWTRGRRLACKRRVDAGSWDLSLVVKLGQYCCTATNRGRRLYSCRAGRCPGRQGTAHACQPCRKNRCRGQSSLRSKRTNISYFQIVRWRCLGARIRPSPACRPPPPGRSGSGRSRWRRWRSWRAR